MSRLWAFLRDVFVSRPDPWPEYSRLDRLDGLGATR